MPKPWAEKANRIIAAVCADAYRAANPTPRKRHRPYHVPDIARDLVDCLNTDDEQRAKSLFLSHDGLNALN